MADENLILSLEGDGIAQGQAGEDLVASAGEEVQGDDVVHFLAVEVRIADRDRDEFASTLVFWIVLNFDTLTDLWEARDFFSVELIDTAENALEHLPHVISRHGDLDQGISKRKAGKDLAASDVARVDCSADSTCVDDSKIDRIAFVLSVSEHGIRHEVAQQTLLFLACRLLEHDVGHANHLCCELFKGPSPCLNLSLQSRILLSGVGKVNGGTMICQDLAFGIVRDINVAQVLAPT